MVLILLEKFSTGLESHCVGEGVEYIEGYLQVANFVVVAKATRCSGGFPNMAKYFFRPDYHERTNRTDSPRPNKSEPSRQKT
jgi:hypothetical protein